MYYPVWSLFERIELKFPSPLQSTSSFHSVVFIIFLDDCEWFCFPFNLLLFSERESIGSNCTCSIWFANWFASEMCFIYFFILYVAPNMLGVSLPGYLHFPCISQQNYCWDIHSTHIQHWAHEKPHPIILSKHNSSSSIPIRILFSPFSSRSSAITLKSTNQGFEFTFHLLSLEIWCYRASTHSHFIHLLAHYGKRQ